MLLPLWGGAFIGEKSTFVFTSLLSNLSSLKFKRNNSFTLECATLLQLFGLV